MGRHTSAGEAPLLEHLSTHGVPTPRPLGLVDTPGEFIAEHAGKPVAVETTPPRHNLRAQHRSDAPARGQKKRAVARQPELNREASMTPDGGPAQPVRRDRTSRDAAEITGLPLN